MNQTPQSARVHIALFGSTNAGKSSIINAITNQNVAVVSDVKGTTTDPVYKSMELLPIGPVVFIDTAGLDDTGELGELRKKKTFEVLDKTDVALILTDSTVGITKFDEEIILLLKDKNIPVIGVLNKIDETPVDKGFINELDLKYQIPFIAVSAKTGEKIPQLKNLIIKNIPEDDDRFKIVGNMIDPGDFVVLVVPIDESAPKGRLILPQQQTIRDILEKGAIPVVCREFELKHTLDSLGKKPSLVITDSQAFEKVNSETPDDIPLTSFSILFARYKGDLDELVRGAHSIQNLQDNDTVLIAEACTHHVQADDIGRTKIPRWLRQLTGKELNFEYSTGINYPADLSKYSLIVHCGGCMLNRRAMLYRIEKAKQHEIPIVNYGVLISYVQGILDRVIQPFSLKEHS